MTFSGHIVGDGATDVDGTRSRARGAVRGGVRLMAAGAVLAAVLTGCGSDSDSDSDSDADATATSTATTAATTAPSSAPAGGGAGGYGGGGSTASAAPAEAGTLTIDNFAFSPANPTFAVGQQVTVTNDDSVPHTWTSADGGFDTGLIQPGGSATVTLEKAGTFDFVCTPHAAQMTGTVTVTS